MNQDNNRADIAETILSIIGERVTKLDADRLQYFQNIDITDDEANSIIELSKSLCAGNTDLNLYKSDKGWQMQMSEWMYEQADKVLDNLYLKEHKNEKIVELGIDIETFSTEDLTTTGVYKYAEADEFQVLLFAYSINNGRVLLVDLASGEQLPENVKCALTDPNVLKTAYNAAFERICLSRYLGLPKGTYLPPEQWDCTMVRAARLGMPLSLKQCGQVLNVTKKKMNEGTALINYFSVPCRATKTNGGRTRNLPHHAPEKWETFKRYCRRDVEVEQQIRERVRLKPVTEKERQLWFLDQHINDRGVLIDIQMATEAERIDTEYKEQIYDEAKKITGLDNPNSVSQLKDWLQKTEHISVQTLNKKCVDDIKNQLRTDEAKRIMQIRAELGKTSTKKYTAAIRCACADNRARGLTQFYGASRTGRWSGRVLQLQNLPQNHISDIDRARRLVKQGDVEELQMYYQNIPSTLSELIRTILIAKPNHIFHVCDFSAIEARVIAWLAGEEWVLETFRNGGDIYCSTASQMFGVPVEKHGRNAELRQNGKIATLACGYQGGIGAMKAMGGERMGWSDAYMQDIVDRWRNANPRIVRLWKHAETAAQWCVKTHETFTMEKGIIFEWRWGGVRIILPSGRYIYYPRMRMGDENGYQRLQYDGVNQTTKAWESSFTYGGKIVENIVQSIARDCLAETMTRMNKAGYPIVFHVHDEAIAECPIDSDLTLERLVGIFGQPIEWAEGLPLKGAGYSTPYYLKD